MRIYFFFNLQTQALLCHEMAKYLNAKGSYEFAGAMAIKGGAHHDYLQEQSDVEYSRLDNLDQLEVDSLSYDVKPDRIAEWEKRLDVPLMHLCIADRNIGHAFIADSLTPSTDIMQKAAHENIVQFICCHLDFFERALKEFSPDLVFYPVAPASLSSLALVLVCEWMGIPCYCLRATRIKGSHIISEKGHLDLFPEVKERFQRLLASPDQAPALPEEIKEYIAGFREGTPDVGPCGERAAAFKSKMRGRSYAAILMASARDLVLAAARVGRDAVKGRELRTKHPMTVWYLNTRKALGAKRRVPCSQEVEPGSEPYIYYPLHVNPEASTMVRSPNFVNQTMLIEVLAKNIPLSHKLYVKEHPGMMGRRPRGFYRKLASYPNVVIVDAGVNSQELARKSDLVIVITGTVGWEGIMMGKPVMGFGNSFYTDVGLAVRGSDLDKLGEQIAETMDTSDVDPTERDRRLELFLAAMQAESFDFDIWVLWNKIKPGQLGEKEIQAAQTLADELIKRHQGRANRE